MKPKLLLIGGGGHCRSVIDVIELAGNYTIAGIIDDKRLLGSNVLGYEVLGCDNDLANLVSQYPNALVTVGQIYSVDIRKKLYELLNQFGFILPTIVSPRAYVSKYASIGAGTIIMHDALINANATVGDNCIINTKALIEHDCVIESHCHVSTGAILNGGSTLKAGSFFGSNAVSKEAITIEERSFIKAGSVAK